jgi:hypothetical protein
MRFFRPPNNDVGSKESHTQSHIEQMAKKEREKLKKFDPTELPEIAQSTKPTPHKHI